MFQANFVEETKTHALCSVIPFPSPENRAFYEIMWKNIVRVRQHTDDNIARRMRYACCITDNNTHLQYVIVIVFPRQQC